VISGLVRWVLKFGKMPHNNGHEFGNSRLRRSFIYNIKTKNSLQYM